MLRMGLLGAARIAPSALLRPAREVADVQVVAVAARNPERARKFAARHGIERIHPDYEALLADPDVDAVYNPLPNALHCPWTLRALDAGKHVLCEKPFCNNADEAERMLQAAERTGLVLMEAFHYRYHPLADRIAAEIPKLGRLTRVDARMCFPLPFVNDIRFEFQLGGGSNMDLGAYTANLVRFAAAQSGIPELRVNPEVVHAEAKLLRPQVDRCMEAELRWSDGTTGFIRNSMRSLHPPAMSLRVDGEKGRIAVTNPVAPHFFHRMSVTLGGNTVRVKVAGKATYTHQLEEFVRQVSGETPKVPLQDSLDTMRLIDAMYRRAGLKLRGT